jgi:hypothetical protein
MTKTLSMVSHMNYNLNANESFVTFLTSELITWFIRGFTLKMKSQSIAHLLSGSKHVYIGFGILKMKCTQYGICGLVAFKNARAMVFSKAGGQAVVSGQIQKILIFFRLGGCPCLNIPPPKSLW